MIFFMAVEKQNKTKTLVLIWNHKIFQAILSKKIPEWGISMLDPEINLNRYKHLIFDNDVRSMY